MQFSATHGSFLWIQADLKVEIRAQLSDGSRGAVGGPALRCAPAVSISLPHCSASLSLRVPPCLLSKAAATIKVRTSGHKTISGNDLSRQADWGWQCTQDSSSSPDLCMAYQNSQKITLLSQLCVKTMTNQYVSAKRDKGDSLGLCWGCSPQETVSSNNRVGKHPKPEAKRLKQEQQFSQLWTKPVGYPA